MINPKTTLPITDIIRKREINPRRQLDPDYIDELKNTSWPPIAVNKEMALIAGFHRLEAAKKRLYTEIEVQIKDISLDEALALPADKPMPTRQTPSFA